MARSTAFARRRTGLSSKALSRAREAGQAKLYSLNRSHLAAPYVEGLGSLRPLLVKRLEESVRAWKHPAVVVLLFGSVARGDAGAESDLDLLVVRRLDTEEESLPGRTSSPPSSAKPPFGPATRRG